MTMTKRFLASLLSTTLLAGPAFAANENLNLLVWEGYADQSYVKEFEEASGCPLPSVALCVPLVSMSQWVVMMT